MNEAAKAPETAAASSAAANARKEFWAWVRWLACTVVLVVVVRSFIFEPVRVLGPSMQNTLFTDQVMAVSKAAYLFAEPQRGDIVVCHYVNISKDNYVKRVIGLPGDTVEVRNSVVYIDGIALPETYLTKPQTVDMAPVFVPEGSYFVMGDNRGDSSDSRTKVIGSIAKKDIVGKTLAIMWPLKDIAIVKH